MEWQEQLNDFMIIGGLAVSNPPIIAKGALLMEKSWDSPFIKMNRFGSCSYHNEGMVIFQSGFYFFREKCILFCSCFEFLFHQRGLLCCLIYGKMADCFADVFRGK